MLWVLLATLGIPIWLIVGFMIAVWRVRRAARRQPGVFELAVRAEHGDRWPRQPSYGRVVRDVLVINRGLALLRADVTAIDAVAELELDDAPRRPANAVGRLLTLDDGTRREAAVSAVGAARLDEAADFVRTPRPGSGR